MSRPLIEPLDPSERLNEDDMASRREAEFLASSMAEHLGRNEGTLIQRGVCTNCGEACMPVAVYCDADCRDDHEVRLAAIARRGSA